MSTPAGQSDEQPLQDRHRSSDSATSAAPKPRTRLPLASSCSTRARPRVESFSSLVASQDGHITPPAAGRVGPAFAHPDAAVHRGGQVAAVVGVGEAEPAVQRPGLRHAQVRVQRHRVDEHAGVERVARVEDGLDRGHDLDGFGRVHGGQQLAAGPAVAVLTRHRAAVRAHQLRRGDHEPAVAGRRGREREVDADVHAAVAEVAVAQSVQAVLGHERGEVTQVRAQLPGRDRGVLPAGPGRRVSRGAAAQARPVLADAPQRPRRGAGNHQGVQAARVGDEPGGRGPRLGLGVPRRLDEQPGLPARQGRDGRVAPAGAEHAHQPRVHPLQRDRPVRQQPGHRVRGLRHAGVAEHRQRDRLRRRHQRHGRAGDHAEGALGPARNFARSAPFSGSRCSRE